MSIDSVTTAIEELEGLRDLCVHGNTWHVCVEQYLSEDWDAVNDVSVSVGDGAD